jgi:hypothetical protein
MLDEVTPRQRAPTPELPAPQIPAPPTPVAIATTCTDPIVAASHLDVPDLMTQSSLELYNTLALSKISRGDVSDDDSNDDEGWSDDGSSGSDTECESVYYNAPPPLPLHEIAIEELACLLGMPPPPPPPDSEPNAPAPTPTSTSTSTPTLHLPIPTTTAPQPPSSRAQYRKPTQALKLSKLATTPAPLPQSLLPHHQSPEGRLALATLPSPTTTPVCCPPIPSPPLSPRSLEEIERTVLGAAAVTERVRHIRELLDLLRKFITESSPTELFPGLLLIASMMCVGSSVGNPCRTATHCVTMACGWQGIKHCIPPGRTLNSAMRFVGCRLVCTKSRPLTHDTCRQKQIQVSYHYMRFASAALGIMLAGLQVKQRVWNIWVCSSMRC